MSKPRFLHHTDTAQLKPFVDAIEEVLRPLRYKSVDELQRLERACENVSDINCGWQTHRAARFLAPIVRHEIRIRKSRDQEAGGK